MKNKYITVLDFEVGRVFQYELTCPWGNSNKWYPDGEICEEYMTEKGHNLSNCEWMIHDDNRVIVQTPHGEIKQLQRDYDMVKSIEKNK